MISAADAHDHAAVGDDVGHRVVLGQPDRMPHRDHVEGTAELQTPCLSGEPERELDEVRKALIAFALEVMLGRPQGVVAELVHQLGDVARRKEGLAQLVVAVAAGIGRRPLQSDIF